MWCGRGPAVQSNNGPFFASCEQVAAVGDELEVKIIHIDRERNKIAGSLVALHPESDPWHGKWQFVVGTLWKNAFFLLPLIRSHREFVFEVEGDPVSFLWHVPISDEERAYKQEHGADALIDRMDAVGLPWVFDENNRPSLLEGKDDGL